MWIHSQIFFFLVKNGFFLQILYCMETPKFVGIIMWLQLSTFIVWKQGVYN